MGPSLRVLPEPSSWMSAGRDYCHHLHSPCSMNLRNNTLVLLPVSKMSLFHTAAPAMSSSMLLWEPVPMGVSCWTGPCPQEVVPCRGGLHVGLVGTLTALWFMVPLVFGGRCGQMGYLSLPG